MTVEPLPSEPSRAASAGKAILAVDRAISELRRGESVILFSDGRPSCLVQAAEGASAEGLQRMRAASSRAGVEGPFLALTGHRAASLGLGDTGEEVVLLVLDAATLASEVRELADPTVPPTHRPWPLRPLHRASGEAKIASISGFAAAAIDLSKLARLLPATLLSPLEGAFAGELTRKGDLLAVDALDIATYRSASARSLKAVGEARVPLQGAENTRIIVFRPSDGGIEHLAIVIGDPSPEEPVLARIHSECFTGDLLGSLRCDCGEQLRGAIGEIGRAGRGILIYLSQEGRGIGLVNKLRAYQLQDRGSDTVDANRQLGFDADERIYLPAAEILRKLGFERVRLLTNNPEKVEGLRRCGVRVEERVPHVFPSNDHNAAYLSTKRIRFGHLV